MEIKDGALSEITVLEGSVEVSTLDGKNKIIVEGGYKAVAGKDVISEPQKIVNIEKWWETGVSHEK